MSVNGTLVEDKMRRFKDERAHFSFNKCPIYTHNGASAKFGTNSHETDNSAYSGLHVMMSHVSQIILKIRLFYTAGHWETTYFSQLHCLGCSVLWRRHCKVHHYVEVPLMSRPWWGVLQWKSLLRGNERPWEAISVWKWEEQWKKYSFYLSISRW